jgi:hypothetical protein
VRVQYVMVGCIYLQAVLRDIASSRVSGVQDVRHAPEGLHGQHQAPAVDGAP